jgi:hypothetical protein
VFPASLQDAKGNGSVFRGYSSRCATLDCPANFRQPFGYEQLGYALYIFDQSAYNKKGTLAGAFVN